jgi:hypothetical protein
MKLFSASKGIIGILAGQAAAREAAHAAHSAKQALFAAAVFFGFLTFCVIITTFYVLLLIIGWFQIK